jgi:hypothetical protein
LNDLLPVIQLSRELSDPPIITGSTMQTDQFFHGSSRPEAGSRAGLSQFHWMSCQEADKSQQGGASGVTEKQLGD